MTVRLGAYAVVAAAAFSSAMGCSAAESQQPLSFANDVVPILTKASCNSGACHAKAGMGQRGFRLSLLGFEPQEDFEHIVKEGHGRRVFPAAPEQSLLLLKAANIVPHGGGKKLDPKSDGYRTIARWIGEGMSFGKDSDAKLASIEVQPKQGSMKVKSQQQLKVLAHYSDGSVRDVTHTALYEPNDKSMAETGEEGLVRILDLPGNVAVMVRYQGLVSVYSASIPLGAPVENLPAAKNFIDKLVFAKLKRIGVPPSPVCDDATFLRRVSLDIAGHLPTTEEANAFLARKEPDKRDKLIESLLSSPDYADYFANKWALLLHNKRDAPSDITANFAFHSWVRDALLANTPYDQMVRQLLAATGTIASNPAVAWYKRVKEPTQQLEDVAQLFPRRADAVRAVPPSSVRALEPARLLQHVGVLLAGVPEIGDGQFRSASWEPSPGQASASMLCKVALPRSGSRAAGSTSQCTLRAGVSGVQLFCGCSVRDSRDCRRINVMQVPIGIPHRQQTAAGGEHGKIGMCYGDRCALDDMYGERPARQLTENFLEFVCVHA